MITFTHCAFMAKQTCATFSKVVQKITPPIANNFLKFFFVLFATLTLNAATAWAETIVLKPSDGFPSSYQSSDKTFTKSEITFGCLRTMYNANGTPSGWYKQQVMQLSKHESSTVGGDIWNVTSINNIVKITVKLAVNNNDFKLFYGTSAKPSTNSIAKSSASSSTETITYSGYSNKTEQPGKTTTINVFTFDLSSKGATHFLIDNGSKANYIWEIVIETSSATPVDPEVTFSNGSYTVGGSALDLSTLWTSTSDGAVTYSLVEAGTTGASINGKSFTATAAGTCTVKASQAATSAYNAIDKTAIITVTAPTPANPYKVTLEAGPGTCEKSVTEASAGAGVTLPTPTLDCGDWKFAGWAEESVNAETTTKPTLIPAGAYNPASNITLYAVYQRTETIQGGGSGNYELITSTSAPDDWSGTYLIVDGTSKNCFNGNLTTLDADGNYKSVTISDNTITSNTTTDSYSVTISKSTTNGKYYIKTASGYYIGSTASTSKDGNELESSTSTKYDNSISINSTNVTIKGPDHILKFFHQTNANWRFRYYKSTTTQNVRLPQLYKKCSGSSTTTYYHSTPDCADPCDALQAPNVTAIVTANSITLSWEAVDGATSYNVYNYTTEEAEEVNVLTYTFNGLDPETEYEWGVESAKGECSKETQGTTTTQKACTDAVNVIKGTSDNGSFKLDKTGGQSTCNGAVTVTLSDIQPAAGYKFSAITQSGINTGVTIDNNNQKVTYAQNTIGNSTINVTFTELPKYTVSFSTGTGNPTQADVIESVGGQGITLPVGPAPACPDWTFAGWAEAIVTETTTEPTLFAEGTNYKPAGNCTLYAVYSQTETTLGEGEELSQTLKYDLWSYTGSTTDKGDYRMFHTGSYVESAPFDLSILTKVVVYGGTFGGDKYNSLTIGDGANVWKTVAVTGNSQTGVNSFTNGNALSGHGKLRITSNSGTASTNGVRISKIEIYTISSITTTTYNSNPDCTTPEPTKYNVIITPTTNGSVTANHTNAEKGETITLTVTPNDGYILDALTVTDASSTTITVINNEFKMPASNVTVSATFKQDESGEVESSSTATIVFASNANQEDGSSSVITEQTEIDEVVAQGIEFVSGFADVSKVYPNSVHGLKLGTSNAIGKITIGLNISKKVSKITFKTYQYKEKEATIKFSAGGKEGSTSEFGDYTLTFDEPTTVSQIVISTGQASKGRAYVSQIDIELAEDEAGEGGEDPVVPTPTVNPTATFVFNTADGLAKLGIAYPTTADGASKKTNIENNTTVISNGVGLTMTGGTTTPTRVWLTPSGVLDLRVYEGATLTFAVADGFEIIKVDFEGSELTNLAVDDIPMTGTIWEGNQKTVTFKNLSSGVKINTIAVTVAYTRDVTLGEYGTICIPYGSNNYTGAEFYEVSWLKEGLGLYLDELAANAELVAGKPYIFLATSDEIEIEIICTGEAVINPVDGKAGLTGTFTKIQDLQTSDQSNTLEGNYMIADNKIWLCGTSCWLNANRAYIDKDGVPTTEQPKLAGRRRVCMGENTTTDFENITNGENNTIKVIENGQLFIIRNGEKYNIQGQKL